MKPEITPVQLDSKRIGLFLRTLNDAEFIYLRHTTEFVDSLKRLMRDNPEMTKPEICNKFNVSPKRYHDFTTGCYNYDLLHVAILNAWGVQTFCKKQAESQKPK